MCGKMLASKLGIEQVGEKLSGKRVLMRVDFNVPIKDGKVTDATRVVATLPTIQFALDHGAVAVILLSHCGRPNGHMQDKYSLKPVVAVLEEQLRKHKLSNKVYFVNDCVGPIAEQAAANAKSGAIVLLENLRFHIEEEGKGEDENGKPVKAEPKQIEKFRAGLTRLGDIFINDAFGTAHRAHASMVGINLPLRAAGLLMKKELDYFAKALEHPRRPFLAIIGGAKVNDKIQMIKNLLKKVDLMIIGGGMAFTFKKQLENMKIGNSLFDEDGASIVGEIMQEAKTKNVKLLLPVDFVCSDKFAADARTQICGDNDGVPDGWMGLDIGPKTVELSRAMIREAKTIVWNGPPGVFELPAFSSGSTAFANAVADETATGAITIVGGGDTASLLESSGMALKVSHISTGGGAALELLEGKELPGVVALSSK